MALRVYTKDHQVELVIDNKHEIFEDTVFADCEFSIKARSLSSVEQARLESEIVKISKRGKINFDPSVVTTEKFVRCVEDWSGIEDENGNPVPCTEETKRAVATHDRDFARLVLQALQDEAELERAAKDEELKN